MLGFVLLLSQPWQWSAHSARQDAAPARDCTTDRAPSPETFVDLSRDPGLIAQRAFGLDLRVRHVADGQPARRCISQFGGDQIEDSVTHLGNVPQPLQLEMIVGGI